MIGKKDDREVARFIAHMKQEIAKIPPYLSAREYRMRAERAKSIAESFEKRPTEVFEKKKYRLLAEKYEQLAKEADMRKKGILPSKSPESRVVVSSPRTEIRVEPVRELPENVIPIMIIGGFILAVFFFLSAYMDWFTTTLDTLTLNLLGGFFLLLAVLGLLVPRGRDKI